MVSIGFTVSLKMLRRIDKLRGEEPRSPFIRRLLQRGLEAEFPEERGGENRGE